jgi:hypothetical protein
MPVGVQLSLQEHQEDVVNSKKCQQETAEKKVQGLGHNGTGYKNPDTATSLKDVQVVRADTRMVPAVPVSN